MSISTRLTLAALVAAPLLNLSPARAGALPGPAPTQAWLATGSFTTVTALVPAPEGPLGPGTPLTLALTEVGTLAPARVEFAGIHYEPRASASASPQHHHESGGGMSQLHMGLFEPDGNQGSRFDFGLRGGPMLDKNLQLGLAVDWIYKFQNDATVISTSEGPGGVPIEVRHDLARSSVNMFPIMGFLQISGNGNLGLIPYVGGGGGYQVMALSGENFTTGETFDGTFGGWGWQAWGGVGLPLGDHSRLNAEVYKNGAELGRYVDDPVSGTRVHETVNGDGVGARFGIAWGF